MLSGKTAFIPETAYNVQLSLANITTRSFIECCAVCERDSQCENIRWKETGKQCEMLGHFYALANDPNPDASYKLMTRYKYYKMP